MDAIPLYVDPAIASMTPEQKRALLIRTVADGSPPPPAVPDSISTAPVAGGVEPMPDGIFNPDVELTAEALHRNNRFEVYIMPGGAKVYVHPTSPEEAGWLNRAALKEVRAMGLLRDGLPADEAARQQQEAGIEVVLRARIYQVITCCRCGPNITDAKVFRVDHVKKLRQMPGYGEAIEEICSISDRLSSGQSEVALQNELLMGFFGGMSSWLTSWCSALNMDSIPTFREVGTDLASSLDSIVQHGKLFPTVLQALPMCLVHPEAAMKSPGKNAEDEEPIHEAA